MCLTVGTVIGYCGNAADEWLRSVRCSGCVAFICRLFFFGAGIEPDFRWRQEGRTLLHSVWVHEADAGNLLCFMSKRVRAKEPSRCCLCRVCRNDVGMAR